MSGSGLPEAHAIDALLLRGDYRHACDGGRDAGHWLAIRSVEYDAAGKPFDGAKTYTLHAPANVPVHNVWSIELYDTQTRSMLQTDQQSLSLSSEKGLTKKC